MSDTISDTQFEGLCYAASLSKEPVEAFVLRNLTESGTYWSSELEKRKTYEIGYLFKAAEDHHTKADIIKLLQDLLPQKVEAPALAKLEPIAQTLFEPATTPTRWVAIKAHLLAIWNLLVHYS